MIRFFQTFFWLDCWLIQKLSFAYDNIFMLILLQKFHYYSFSDIICSNACIKKLEKLDWEVLYWRLEEKGEERSKKG